MPNHIHLIIGDTDKSISKIISGLKSLYLNNAFVENQNILENGKQELSATVKFLIQEYNSIWQKSFYDHVIRDDKDLQRIREYIVSNALNWHLDSLNPINCKDG